MSNKLSFKTIALLSITIFFWSSAFVGIRLGLHGYTPGGLALLRYGVASICMIFIYKKFARGDSLLLRHKLMLMVIGAVGIGWYNLLLNYGEITVDSGTSSFIVSQGPIISSILAIFFLRERGTYLSFLGMTISVFGVFLISVGHAGGLRWENGIGYILIATFFGSLYTILQKPFVKKYHAIDVTAYIIWGCTFSLFMYLPDVVHGLVAATAAETGSIIYLGIFPAAIAYVSWSYVLAEMPATRAVSFLYFAPIIATLLGWLCLDEIPSLLSLVGGVIAMLGVWGVNHSYHLSSKTKMAVESQS